MIFTIIMWASIIWIAPFIYYMLANEAKFKKNIAVGVTLPYDARDDEEVKSLLTQYKDEIKWICLALIAVAIPCFFIRNVYTTLTVWSIWVLVCIVLPYVPYVKCNTRLKKLKVERGWKQSESGIIRIDTASIPSNKWLSPWSFLPAVILCLVPLIWDRSFWILYVTLGIWPPILWLCYRYLYRNKSETVDTNIDIARALTQVRRYNWGKMWLFCAYFFAAFCLGISITQNSPLWSTLIIIALSFVIVIAAFRVEMKTRRLQEKLTADSGKDWYVDEDDNWIGGILYYNPNDSRLIINNRVGINSSINVAKTSGKIIMGLIVLLLLTLPFTGTILRGIGEQPLVLELTDTDIVSGRGNSLYSVPFEDIAEVELLGELPDSMVRTFGTAMENLLKGNFTAKGIGSLKICLDPNCPPYILIKTTDNQHYLFGSRDSELTGQIFEQLTTSTKARP